MRFALVFETEWHRCLYILIGLSANKVSLKTTCVDCITFFCTELIADDPGMYESDLPFHKLSALLIQKK